MQLLYPNRNDYFPVVIFRALRKIFEVKGDGIAGEWRKLHNDELNGLYSSPDIIMNLNCRRAHPWGKRLVARFPPLRWGPRLACRSLHVG